TGERGGDACDVQGEAGIRRSSVTGVQTCALPILRERLQALVFSVVRYQPITVESAWKMNNTKNKGLESLSYRLEFSNQLSATARSEERRVGKSVCVDGACERRRPMEGETDAGGHG